MPRISIDNSFNTILFELNHVFFTIEVEDDVSKGIHFDF